MSTEQHLLMSWLADQFGSLRERLARIEAKIEQDKRGAWHRALLSPKALPWAIAAILMLGGQLTVSDLKALIGIAGR